MVLTYNTVLIQYDNYLVIFYHNVPFFAAIFTFWGEKRHPKKLTWGVGGQIEGGPSGGSLYLPGRQALDKRGGSARSSVLTK
jgi:hypothetical protein